jgi:uncharacterized protein with PIN domain
MRCHICGRKATKKLKDPYLEEINPEKDNPEVWWCDGCYQDSLYDI